MLSNLLWWPWHGLSDGGPPPVVGGPVFSGDKRPPLVPDSWGEPWRNKRKREQEDEDLISVILDSL